MINAKDYTAEAKNMDNGTSIDIMNEKNNVIAAFVGCSPSRVNELRKASTKVIKLAEAKGEGAFVLVWNVWVKNTKITIKHKSYAPKEIYSMPISSESITHKQSFITALPYGLFGTKADPNLPAAK